MNAVEFSLNVSQSLSPSRIGVRGWIMIFDLFSRTLSAIYVSDYFGQTDILQNKRMTAGESFVNLTRKRRKSVKLSQKNVSCRPMSNVTYSYTSCSHKSRFCYNCAKHDVIPELWRQVAHYVIGCA